MAEFTKHNDHALENHAFLGNICNDYSFSEYRWKTTAVFYTALHLVNAYLAEKMDFHPTSHYETKNAINNVSGVANIKFTESLFLSYSNLENLSRKARYISEMKFQEKHFIEALGYLNEIAIFYSDIYPSSPIAKISVQCFDEKYKQSLTFFEISKN